MKKGKETQSESPNPDQSVHILIRLFLAERGIKESCSISQCLRSSKYQNPDHSFSSASLFMLHLQISIGFTLRHCIFQQLLPGKAVLSLPAQPTGDVSSVKISSASCCPPTALSPWPGLLAPSRAARSALRCAVPVLPDSTPAAARTDWNRDIKDHSDISWLKTQRKRCCEVSSFNSSQQEMLFGDTGLCFLLETTLSFVLLNKAGNECHILNDAIYFFKWWGFFLRAWHDGSCNVNLGLCYRRLISIRATCEDTL